MINIEFSLIGSIVAFLVGAGVIAIFGSLLTSRADELADRTSLGEALMGALFLGAVTSLPGITASVAAAWSGQPSLALSNAIGGIAAQTAFLAVADMTYRKANLEHAAPSAQTLTQAALLVVLLAMMIAGMVGPAWSCFGVHPLSPSLLAVYLYGTWMTRKAQSEPMWTPTQTTHTVRENVQQTPTPRRLWRLWLEFIVLGALVIGGGWLVLHAVEDLADFIGMNQSIAGAALVAVATSLPELITAIAAVRRGALRLAIGAVIGGNAFDTLFAAVADLAYREGSIYHHTTSRELILMAMSIVMTGTLLLGLIRRERQGIGGIGFESFGVLLFYVISLIMIAS